MPNSTCSVDGCDKPVSNKANGWCMKHYYRHYRHGDINGCGAQGQHRRLPIEVQFASYVHVVPSGCHEWQGGKLKDGYGGFRSRPAHRWIWTRTNGPIPKGMVVRHKCDNPPCVNIDHLELGAMQDNADDMVIRGRSLKGTKNAIAKLSDDDVRAIKIALRDKASLQKDIADRYKVTPTLISYIKTGRAWSHISIEAV